MPAWKAAMILLSWGSIFLIVSVSALLAAYAGTVLWLRYAVRCPGMILACAAFLLVVALSLPLLG